MAKRCYRLLEIWLYLRASVRHLHAIRIARHSAVEAGSSPGEGVLQRLLCVSREHRQVRRRAVARASLGRDFHRFDARREFSHEAVCSSLFGPRQTHAALGGDVFGVFVESALAVDIDYGSSTSLPGQNLL